MTRSASACTCGLGDHRPTAVSPAPRGLARVLRPGPPARTAPVRSAYPWKNQSRSGPGGRKAWSSRRLPASSARRYSSPASRAERTSTVLRSPPPGGTSQGRLHFATTGSPSRHAARAASAGPSGTSVSGCGTPSEAHTPANSALSATRSGRLPGWSGSRNAGASSARARLTATAHASSIAISTAGRAIRAATRRRAAAISSVDAPGGGGVCSPVT
ncbi:hypothetical protein ACH121_24875 [Streptomyces sp. NB004]